ncbi:MAG TPA: efflux transporter periplasmic adaptor subunit, partial [Terriglobales bacterium]
RNVGEVVVQVDNSDAKLLPNTNVTVAVTLARDNNVLTVAREAIHMDANGRYVYVIEDGRLKRQSVDTAISSLTRIEVTKGLQAGQVVALGAYNGQALRDGMPVKTTS